MIFTLNDEIFRQMKKVTNGYATKKDLRELEGRIDQRIWTLEEKIDKNQVEYDNKLTDFKDKVFMGLDWVLKELVILRQEQIAQSAQLEKHTELLNQHTRILDQHTKLLNQHTGQLNQHTKLLDQHTDKLGSIENRLTTLETRKT